MKNLEKIKENLHRVTLETLWDQEFYSARDMGITPCNSDYYFEKPFRILYDGLFNHDGLVLEFTVGIMSDDDSDMYEFFVEDYQHGSLVEHYPTFDEALKRFVRLTHIRKPYIYIDDAKGNAVRVDYQVKPFAIVTKD